MSNITRRQYLEGSLAVAAAVGVGSHIRAAEAPAVPAAKQANPPGHPRIPKVEVGKRFAEALLRLEAAGR